MAVSKGKKPVAKKSAASAKKTAPAKKVAVKKVVAKKVAAKKPVAKKPAAKKPALKKPVATKPVQKKAVAKKVPIKTVSATNKKTAPQKPAKSSTTKISKIAKRIVSDTAQKPTKKKAASIFDKRPLPKIPKDLISPATGTATNEPFSAKEIEKFREHIHTIREEAQQEFDSLNEQLREITSREMADENAAYSIHMAEQGTDAMEREKTFLQAQRSSDYIKRLEEAYHRTDEGTFGLCRICGLRLDTKRLMAVPVTQVCTVYKNTAKPCEPGKLYLQTFKPEEHEESEDEG